MNRAECQTWPEEALAAVSKFDFLPQIAGGIAPAIYKTRRARITNNTELPDSSASAARPVMVALFFAELGNLKGVPILIIEDNSPGNLPVTVVGWGCISPLKIALGWQPRLIRASNINCLL